MAGAHSKLDGEDLRRQPIEVRKALLANLLHGVFSTIVVNEHFEGDGTIIYRHACKLGCEGIVGNGSARRISPADRHIG